MKTFAIFISSTDSYSDIWDVFFYMFKKFWPECDKKIYLQTEEKSYSYEGLNIVCTNVGKQKAFGATLRAGLDKIEEDNILFIMIDYIFMGFVETEKLDILYKYFCSQNLDSLCLKWQGLPGFACYDRKEINKYLPSNHVFNYQIAFWKKSVLYEMALPHENPWTSEWYGNKRALQANLDIRTINKKMRPVFVYDAAGCLHQGKWLLNAVDFLRDINYNVDFSKRGFYKNDYNTLRVRIRIKLNMILHGLKGSYWCKIHRECKM